LLREFWTEFRAAVDEIGELRMGQVLEALNETLGAHIFRDKGDGVDPRACPNCGDGRLSLKAGKFGAFVGCSNYPACRFTRPIGAASDEGEAAAGDRSLGVDPVSGNTIWLKAGRFGPYVEEAADKPKRASLPKDWPPAGVDLEKGLRLLRLPREIGPHPQGGAMIVAGIGRYGPYVQHERTYANLATTEDVFEVGLNRAVTLLAEKRSPGNGGRGSSGTPLKDLGAHPTSGKPVRVLSGRYGPYVKHEATNANVPRGSDPAALTLDEAVVLLAAREGKSAGRASKAGRKPAGARRPPAKKKSSARRGAVS
jgi:DNA topoisomerase-1